jgi:hypothetical protein
MIPSRIAHDLALMHHKSLLITFKISEAQADALTRSVDNLINTAIQLFRAEIETERDETRRRFYEVHPNLHPERGHMPPALPTTKLCD